METATPAPLVSNPAESAAPVSLPDPSAEARSRGRRGGLKGGLARAAALTPAQRKRIASEAAKARWAELRQSALATGGEPELKRQVALLVLRNEGLTDRDIAAKLGVSISTVGRVKRDLLESVLAGLAD